MPNTGRRGRLGSVGVDRDARARIVRIHSAARARYSGSGAEHMWRRLSAMDFINRGMLLSAVLLLCFVPFIMSLKALAGRSVADTAVRRVGHYSPRPAGPRPALSSSPP